MMVDVLLLMGRVDSDLAPVQTGIGPPGVTDICQTSDYRSIRQVATTFENPNIPTDV